MSESNEGRGTLLVVEDSEDLVEVWKILFAHAGYAARFCATGQAALALVDEGYAPDVLITDFYLPDLTGLQVIRQVRARNAGVRFLMVTGHSDEDFLQRLREEGIEVICKPAKFDGLVARLSAMIDGDTPI